MVVGQGDILGVGISRAHFSFRIGPISRALCLFKHHCPLDPRHVFLFVKQLFLTK